jgi:hypothetical protein
MLEDARRRLDELGVEPEPPTLWEHTLADHEVAQLARLEHQRADLLESLGAGPAAATA